MSLHTKYMNRCLEIAGNGLGRVAPNPMVGAVIVRKGMIIGEGFHRQYGGAHAEVNAIQAVKNKDLLRESTLYVNLEPCSHYGKTPPCSDLIIENNIPSVVVGNTDPNPEVAGRGLKRLKENGIEVVQGILEEEARLLNRRFFTFHEKERPYIILKWAETRDGFMDIDRRDNKSRDNRITGPEAKRFVHLQRASESAIMVGTNTALNDDPELTAREVAGSSPLRIVIDENLSLPSSLHLLDRSVETMVFNKKKEEIDKNISYKKIPFDEELPQSILKVLFRENTLSLIIEGGPFTLQKFIDRDLWDEAFVFTGNKWFEKGLKGPYFPYTPEKERQLGRDTLSHYLNTAD